MIKYFNILLLCSLCFCACTKIDVDSPDFDVAASSLTCKAKDTIVFTFSGTVQNIVFYSGEPGKEYAHINRTEADGTPQLQFTSTLQNAGELNTLRLMASTDFAGTLTPEGINAATWSDITSRAVLSTGSSNTASGIIDLSDFKGSKPLYLALKYVGYKHATLKQPTWTIPSFNVNNILPEGNSSSLMTIGDAGWVAVDIKNPTTQWALSTTGQPSITGYTTTNSNDDNEDWLVSKPLRLNLANPDTGTSIQDIGSAQLLNFPYIFNTAGVYTVTLVAFNSSIDEHKQVLKQFTITVLP